MPLTHCENLRDQFLKAWQASCERSISLKASRNVSQAQTWDKKTTITVNKPWTLPGNTVLQPGTYVMRLYDSPSNRQVVEVWNADETKLEARTIGIPKYRLEPTDQTVLNFYERRTPGPATVQSWFYPGSLAGVEFPAPKSAATDLAQVDVKAPEPAPAPEQPPAIAESEPPAPPVATAEPEPAPAPEPEAQPQAEPPLVAQLEEPPAPQPELPKTASDAPILALIGLLSLAGAALVRSFVKS
jgi:LPXTG-motif cell wall-anchored protein